MYSLKTPSRGPPNPFFQDLRGPQILLILALLTTISPTSNPLKIDYCNPFALHFYGMIYAFVMQERDSERSKKYKDRALLFAKQFIHLFSHDRACIPYGRSCTYRFAVDGFWGMLACFIKADEEPIIPWCVLKGTYLRNLRWWSKQPVSFFRTNILPVGFSYSNQFVCENYNSPQSPYWCLKAFASRSMYIARISPFLVF